MINFIKKHKDILLVPIILISIFLTWFVYFLSSYINDNIKSDSISLTFDDNDISLNSQLNDVSEGFFYDLIFNTNQGDNWYQQISVDYMYNNNIQTLTLEDEFYQSSYWNVFDNNYSSISQEKVSNIVITYLDNINNIQISSSDIIQVYYRMYIKNFSQFNNNDLSNAYQVNIPVYVSCDTFDVERYPYINFNFLTPEWVTSGSTHLEFSIFLTEFKEIDSIGSMPFGLYYDFEFYYVINNSSSGSLGGNYFFNYSTYSPSEYTSIINNLTQQIYDLNSHINSLSNTNNYNIELINSLESQISSLQDYISYLESNIINDDDTISYLNSQIDVLNHEISILRNQLQNGNAEFNFTRLLWTIGSLPLESFKTMYNVSFLGVNLSEIFLGIVFLGLIIFLFRKFFGMFFHL